MNLIRSEEVTRGGKEVLGNDLCRWIALWEDAGAPVLGFEKMGALGVVTVEQDVMVPIGVDPVPYLLFEHGKIDYPSECVEFRSFHGHLGDVSMAVKMTTLPLMAEDTMGSVKLEATGDRYHVITHGPFRR
jgi:hypothetical protein